MNSSVPEDSENESDIDPIARIQPVHKPEGSAHLDPISGEPHAHPVGVGVGALGAGTAGGLIGAILGPVGAVIGAAIGAVTGGLAGKEVAQSAEHKEAVIPEESVEAPASYTGDSHAAEDTYEDADVSPVHEDLTEKSADSAVGGSAAGNFLPAAAEPAQAPVSHSGVGHVAAASLASDEAPTASGFSTPATAPDPIAEDVKRQSAGGAVPFNAASSVSEDFAPQRLPLTPEDTDVHVASVPNDMPKIDEPKGPLNHDLLFDHGDTPDAATHPSAESGSYVGSSENTSESTVRTKAYYNYLDRQQSGRPGDEFGDWVEAEHDVPKG